MRNCLCIILFLVLGLTLPAVSAYAYGDSGGEGAGGTGGDPMIDIESTSSDPTTPPSGFEPTTSGSAASETTTSSETDPGKEEEVAELVEEVNLMEETDGGSGDKTDQASAPYWTVGGHISSWINNNPIKAWRDSVVNRVPRGECCVDASRDRANDLAAHFQRLVDSGELDLGGHTIKIGSRSGYQVPLSGWATGLEENIGTHTYTVVQIYDANGNFQGAWEADTYVTNIVLPHGEVDLVREYPEHVQSVASKKR
jgi:hypothetical protein